MKDSTRRNIVHNFKGSQFQLICDLALDQDRLVSVSRIICRILSYSPTLGISDSIESLLKLNLVFERLDLLVPLYLRRSEHVLLFLFSDI